MATKTQVQTPFPQMDYLTHPYDPRTMGFDPSSLGLMQNPDPTNDFMYQIPGPGPGHLYQQGQGQMSGMASNGTEDKEHGIADNKTNGGQSELDLDALNQRLRTLGLQHQPYTSPEKVARPTTLPQQHPQDFLSPDSTDRRQLASLSSARGPPHHYPSIAELRPSDSISMYRRAAPHEREPSVRSGRRGGTNVDGGEGEYQEEQFDPNDTIFEYDANSYGTPGRETRMTPGPEDDEYLEQMTVGPTSAWTGGPTGGDMYTMRERLLNSSSNDRSRNHQDKSSDPMLVSSAMAKLQVTEDQLRTLQATLIAERVARTQAEMQAQKKEEQMNDCKYELRTAVEALRRAKKEGKRTEEEKRRVLRSFEEAQRSLHVYNTALEVRKAREQGRAEGRDEAWAEAGRWMGHSPPIPVQSVQTVPTAVLQHTPMMQANQQLYASDSTNPHTVPQAQAQSHGVPQQSPFNLSSQPVMDHSQFQQSQQPPVQPFDGGGIGGQYAPAQVVLPSVEQQAGLAASQQPQMPSVGQAVHQQMHVQSGGHSLPHVVPASYVQSQANPIGQHQAVQSVPMVLAQAAVPHVNPPVMVPMISVGVPTFASVPQIPIQLPTQAQISQPAPGRVHRSASLSHPHVDQSRTIPRSHPADSFLNRVEHSPRLKHLLAGTPKVHSVAPIHSNSFDRSTVEDKPLPNPMVQHGSHIGLGHPPASSGQGHTRTRSMQDHSRPGGAHSMVGDARPRRAVTQRYSLMEGLHDQQHAHAHVGNGDRYPPFPINGHSQPGHARGHSRQSSFATTARINPANYPLPMSTTDHSALQTPVTARQNGTMKMTPQSKVSNVRSKMAGALRNDTELDSGDLARIEEERDEAALHGTRHGQAMHQPVRQQRPATKYAPSMPPMRARPIPVMPSLLGQGGGGKAGSEPHHHHQLPRAHHQDPRGMYGRDQAANLTDRLPKAKSAYDIPHAHPLYVPPGLAPQAVGADVLDVQGGRHSSLGLEGMEARGAGHTQMQSFGEQRQQQDQQRYLDPGSDSGGTMKAPTIMIQPPSTRSNTRLPSLQPSEYKTPKKANRALETQPHPHDIPLPSSRSQAPTAYTPKSHGSMLSPEFAPHPQVHTRTRSGSVSKPAINIIDYAIKQPLPVSRPTTFFDPSTVRDTVITTEIDADVPGGRIHAKKQITVPKGSTSAGTGPTAPAGGKRKGISPMGPSGSGTVDPRQIPLPASRAPTHRNRASTYAGTVATIEEVTEEESGRENIGPHRRRK